MEAVQLKFDDGKATGLWYCGKCREIFHGATAGGKPCSDLHREQADKCCTGAARWVPATWKTGGSCTGCRKALNACICGRAAKHCCVACGSKLFQREGVKVRWGSEIREVCYKCSKTPTLAAMLVDAAKQPSTKGNKRALTAPDTFLSTLAAKARKRSGKGETW